jgi:magnesium chelatase family protein
LYHQPFSRHAAALSAAKRGCSAAAKTLDLADVRGMETARRALEIAAAGGHNMLMIGPPGGGKSMLASRLPGLLPDLSPREALEVSMVHSVAGLLEDGRLVTRPPFREPHHSASMAAMTGGGNRAKPGEVSLAHRGVLFMDEMPEFPAPRWRPCGSRWKPGIPPSPAPPPTSPIRRGSSSSAR